MSLAAPHKSMRMERKTLDKVHQGMITINHSPKDSGTVAAESQLSVQKGEVVDVLHQDFEGKWWKCRNGAGIEGLLPAGCMMILGENVHTQRISQGVAGSPAEQLLIEREKSKVTVQMSRVVDEWNVSTFATVIKLVKKLKYDQWSKAAFVCASYIVILQCILVVGWHYHETERIEQGGLSEFAKETRRYHILVSVIFLIALPVFFGVDRLLFGSTPIPRCLFCWIMGVALYNLHPSILGGFSLILVSLLSFGAWKTKEKCRNYDRKLNALPLIDPLVDAVRELITYCTPAKTYSWKFREMENKGGKWQPKGDWKSFSESGKKHESVGEGEDILESVYSDFLKSSKSADAKKRFYDINLDIPDGRSVKPVNKVLFGDDKDLGPLPRDSTCFALHKQPGEDGKIDRAYYIDRHTEKPPADHAVTHDAHAEAPHTSGGLTEQYREALRTDRLGKFLVMFVYLGINTFLYIEAHLRTKSKIDELDLGLSSAAPVAKGCGAVLNFNCALIAVPVLGAVLRYLHRARLTSLDRNGHVVHGRTLDYYIPVGKNVTFHRYIAWFTMLAASVHTMAHFVNYGKSAEATYAVFPHLDGVWATGLVIIWCQLLMYSAALETVRRSCFNAFWFSHHLFVVFWGCLLYHGPVFYIWSAFPLVLYFWSRYMRDKELDCHVILQEMVLEPPDVIKLTMRNKEVDREFDMWPYEAGQYVRINCPFIAPLEWHPFTISSGPESNTLTLHIKVTRPDGFTGKLKAFMDSMNTNGHRVFVLYNTDQTEVGVRYAKFLNKPLLKIDGPHSAPCQHICEYEVSMLFGAGIGLTPFSASLSSIVDHKWMRTSSPRSLYLYWSFRMNEYSMYSWFVKLLSQIRARYLGKKLTDREFAEVNLQLNLYATRGFNKEEEKIIFRTMRQTPVTATYDRSAPQRLVATKNDPRCGDRKKDGQLRVYEGDTVQLLGTCALEGVSAWHIANKLPDGNDVKARPNKDGPYRSIDYWRVKVAEENSIVPFYWKPNDNVEVGALPFSPRGYCIDPEATAASDNKTDKLCIINPTLLPEKGGTALKESPHYEKLQSTFNNKADRLWIPRPEVADGKLFFLYKDPGADEIAHCRALVSAGHQNQGATRGVATVGWVSADALQYEQPRQPELQLSERHECFSLKSGRPNYMKIFDSVLKEYEGTEITNIGVFCCGPMGKQLRAACLKKSKVELDADGNPIPGGSKIFKLHAEVF